MAFGRRFWHRVVDVMGTLYRALKTSVGMSRGALQRSIRVIKTIVSTPSMRELLHHRHLHQVTFLCSDIIQCIILADTKLRADYHVRDIWILQGREKRRSYFQAHYSGLHLVLALLQVLYHLLSHDGR